MHLVEKEFLNFMGKFDTNPFRIVMRGELYLCSCAAALMNGMIALHQILFTEEINKELPLARWY